MNFFILDPNLDPDLDLDPNLHYVQMLDPHETHADPKHSQTGQKKTLEEVSKNI